MDEQVLHHILKFSKRVKRDRFAKVYAPLGDGYRRVGLLEDAIFTCQKGLEIFPRYLACHEVLGKVYLRQNKLADAKRELEKVHSAIGENFELRKALAKLYSKTGDRLNAAQLLDWLIERDPFDFEIKNLRTQLLRETGREIAKQGAIARGEDPASIDIYELAEKSSLVDIKSIIEQTVEAKFDKKAIKKATDKALDGLEDIETTIDSEADRLMQASMEEAAAAGNGKKKKRRSAKQQEMLDKSVEEISAAAVIAQVELEISLLDEASILCHRLYEQQHDDPELRDLAEKFENRLEEKEAELDRLERINLARGL